MNITPRDHSAMPVRPTRRHDRESEPRSAGTPMTVESLAAFGAIALALVGGLMQFASVSVISGDSIYWIGGALAVLAVGLAIAKSGRTWIVIATIVVVGLCAINIISTEHQLNQRRQEISNLVGS